MGLPSRFRPHVLYLVSYSRRRGRRHHRTWRRLRILSRSLRLLLGSLSLCSPQSSVCEVHTDEVWATKTVRTCSGDRSQGEALLWVGWGSGKRLPAGRRPSFGFGGKRHALARSM